MLMQVKAGAKGLGARAQYRLQQAEREAGIRDYGQEELARVSAAAAHTRKTGGGPGEFGRTLDLLHRSPEAERALEARVLAAEGALADLREGMRSLLAASERDYPLPGRVGSKAASPAAVSRTSKVRRRAGPAPPAKSPKV